MLPPSCRFWVVLSLLFWSSNLFAQGKQDDLAILRGRMVKDLTTSYSISKAKQYAEELGKDGRWPTVDYTSHLRSSWPNKVHLSYLLEMVKAYTATKSPLRGDAKLRNAIDLALNHWLAKDYQNPNWWHNQIGVPLVLGRTLLLLNNELSEKQRAEGVTILKRGKIGMTGQNRIWLSEVTLYRGLLTNDAELVTSALREMTSTLCISDREGIRPDFSFHQHGKCLYTFGYGEAFVTDLSRLACLVKGTQFAFTQEKIDLLAATILDGTQWLTFGTYPDPGGHGRGTSRPSRNLAFLKTTGENMLKLKTGRDEEFRQMLRRITGKTDPALDGTRFYRWSDTLAHHRKNWYVSIRGYSTRVLSTDVPCNSEGLLNHHISDGCMLLLQSGDEYREIYPVWDWQKIPGTTVEQAPKPTGKFPRHSPCGFVGAATDGRNALFAFDFARDSLRAKKAWFLTDNAVLCLGAGITSTSAYPVVTTVNQSLLNDKKARQVGEWVTHADVAYHLPATATLDTSPKTGSWKRLASFRSSEPITRELFTLTINHGIKPNDATYQYLVLPRAGDEIAQWKERAAPLQVLSNTSQLQAVAEVKRRIAGAIFYSPGKFLATKRLAVKVDIPCIVLVDYSDEKTVFHLAEPTGKAKVLTLTCNGRERIVSLPRGRQAGNTVKVVW